MKKMLLISTALVFVAVATAQADVVCDRFDAGWCTNGGRGYISENSANVSGFSEVLRCPFASGLVYVEPAQVKDDCEVGDIIFSDNKCYVNETEILTQGTKTPKAVVFDPINKLALELKSVPQGQFIPKYKWQNEGSYSPFYDSDNKPKILSFGTQISSMVPCTINQIDKNLCSAQDVADGNNRCPTQYGCKVAGVSTKLPIFTDFVSSTPYVGGWQNTIAMAEGGVDSGFASGSTAAFPAAYYCYSKNLNQATGVTVNSSRAKTEASAGKVWFLPSAADLYTLAKACPGNYTNCVGQKIVTINEILSSNYVEYGYGESGDNSDRGRLWSSTQDYKKETTSGHTPIQGNFYYYAVAPKGTASLNGCNGWNVNMEYGIKKRTDELPVLCVYHYGDDWDMSSYSGLWATQTQQESPDLPPMPPLNNDPTIAPK